MEKEKRTHKAHCIVLPYPSQGHINPMLQFSKRLVHKGTKVTLAITRFVSKSLLGDSGPVAVETISDGHDEGGSAQADSDAAYLDQFQVVGTETLSTLIEKLKTSEYPVDCIVYDAFLPWVLDVAKKSGLVGAVFFTQSCTVNNVYYHVQRGILKLPLSETEVTVPGMFPIKASDLPSFVHLYGSYPTFFDMLVNQFSNIEKVDWMFCNTFYKLEDKVKCFFFS